MFNTTAMGIEKRGIGGGEECSLPSEDLRYAEIPSKIPLLPLPTLK